MYELKGNTWEQLGQNIIEEEPNDEFGNSVCISSDGNRIAIGGSTGVYVYDFVGSSWQQLGGTLLLPEMDNVWAEIDRIRFSEDGNSIAFAGRSDLAEIIIYELSGNNWVQKGNNLPSDVDEEFGLSADGNRLACLASSTQAGHIYEVRVFELQNDMWNIVGDTIRFPEGYRWADGIDIAGNGNRVVFSLENKDGSANGAIGIYDFVGEEWVQNGSLLDHEIFTSHNVTLRVSHDGNTFVIGNTFDYTVVDQTTVAVYEYTNQSWQLMGDILPGAAHDETAEGHVDITADGTRFIMGGVKSGPSDFRGFVKVYDFGNPSVISQRPNTLKTNIFPNPSSGLVHLDFGLPNNHLLIQLLNDKGQILHQHQVSDQNYRIELPNSPGLYILNILADNGEHQAFRVLKQ